MQRIPWLLDELQGSYNVDTIIDFLNNFPSRLLHPIEKKRALREWGHVRGIEITHEMLERLEKTK